MCAAAPPKNHAQNKNKSADFRAKTDYWFSKNFNWKNKEIS